MAIVSTSQEMVDIVNEKDEVIGIATRAFVYAHDVRNRAVNVFVYNPITQKFAFQQRGADVWWQPNHIGASTCGHVQARESYRIAAQRETKEEIGLLVQEEELLQLGQPFPYDCPVMGHPFMLANFLVMADEMSLKHDEREVQRLFMWTLDELKQSPHPHNNLLKPAIPCLEEYLLAV